MQTRNFTEYTGAEEWLQVNYPHLYTIWMQSLTSQDDQSMMNLELPCKVCRLKPSTGIHYGVKMCEADKQFLKRTFHHQMIYSPCPQEGYGVCPPRPRGWCQMCRLRRCLSTPVAISMIRVGNKVPKTRQTQSMSLPLFTITVENPPSLPQIKEDHFSRSSTQHYEDRFKLSSLQPVIEEQTVDLSSSPSQYFQERLKYHLQQINQSQDNYRLTYPYVLSDYRSSTKYNIIKTESLDEKYDDGPLDLRIQSRKQLGKDWFDEESSFAQSQLHTNYVLLDDQPLDLSPLSHHTDQLEATDLSRPSSVDCHQRRTPSPILDASHCMNKLSVNSTLLGDALSRIQGNISMSNSLVNLSSISDILSEADK